MTKCKSLFFILLASVLAFSSCDKTSTVDVPLDNVTIALEDILVSDASKSTTNFFSVTQPVTYAMIAGLSDDADKYRSQIESITADTVYITITSTDNAGTVVENFLIKVDNLDDLSILRYVIGTEYMANNLSDYVMQLFKKLLKEESVELNISGETDVASGESLKVKITLINVTLKAKVVNL